MEEQLRLVETDYNPWEIDERTREVGLRGLEQARQALRQAAIRVAA